MWRKTIVFLFIVVCLGAYFIIGEYNFGGTQTDIRKISIPDPYYIELKKADANNPDDIIRYSSSIKDYASDLDIFQKAAFYEWCFKCHDFNVSFAYTDNFDNSGQSHLWLLVKNRKGDIIEVEPSYREMGKFSIVPLGSEYLSYEKEFGDIYETCRYVDVDKLAWWKDDTAGKVLHENILLAKKKEARGVVSGG